MHRSQAPRPPPTFNTLHSVPVVNRLPFDKCSGAEVTSKGANLRLNSFKLQLPHDKTINKCELKFWGCYGHDGKIVKDLATGLKMDAGKDETEKAQGNNDVSAQHRRFCITQLYDALLNAHSDVFKFEMDKMGKYKHIYVYDRIATYYSDVAVPLRDHNAPLELDRELVHPDVLGKLKNPSRMYATLMVSEALDLQKLAPDSADVKMFYEILLCQTQLDGSNWLKFGSRMVDIEDSNAVEIDDLCTLYNGHSKSILNYKTGNGTIEQTDLQFDARLSAFYKATSLCEFINRQTGLRAGDDWTEGRAQRLLKEFKGMFVTTHTYKERPEIFKIDSFSKERADMIMFTNRDGTKQSVADFFLQTYKVTLRYPHLPCAAKKAGAKMCYYPLEYLNVQSGQRYPKDKMTKDQESVMIKKSQRLPQVLIEAIKEQKGKASINDNDSYISSAGVKIGNELENVRGYVIPPPLITYRNSSKTLTFAEWAVRGDQFVNPGRFSFVAVYYFDIPEKAVNEFCEMLFGEAKKFGITIGNWDFYALHDQEISKKTLVEKVNSVKGTNYVFFLGDFSGFHDIVKSTEPETCIPTQQVMPRTVLNVVEKKQFLTIGNILMKMNLKRGGENHYFQQHVGAVYGNQKFDLFKSFLVSTMILGIDFSHPGPGVSSDDFDLHPSVVGFAYSYTDNGNVARGGFRYIRGRQTILNEDIIGDILKTALEKYADINGKEPERILVYRSGVSGGQKEKLLEDEAVGMGTFAKKWYEQRQKTIPYIIVVGCIRSHGARLFKPDGNINNNDRAPQQNVAPGTAIEFYDSVSETLMVPHRALQGTVKPTLFKILFDSYRETSPDKAVRKEILDHISHALCYMHEIVSSAISVPAHLRSAEQMANRGRRLWASSHHEIMNNGQVDFSVAAQTFNPQIDTRYWA